MLAYDWIAARVGRSSRWVQGATSGAFNRIDSEVGGKISELLVQELREEHARLQTDLVLARQCGERLDSDQISEIETQMDRIRALLDGGMN
jgi:hypothetical protein